MRSSKRKWRVVAFCISLVLLLAGTAFSYQKAQMMSGEQLKIIINDPDVAIIDVRTGIDWNSSEWKIKGAVREDPLDVDAWAPRYPKDKMLVIYCA
jgi:rhodanese-related sulfurtransferase